MHGDKKYGNNLRPQVHNFYLDLLWYGTPHSNSIGHTAFKDQIECSGSTNWCSGSTHWCSGSTPACVQEVPMFNSRSHHKHDVLIFLTAQ